MMSGKLGVRILIVLLLAGAASLMALGGHTNSAQAGVFELILTDPSCSGATISFYYDGLPSHHANLLLQPDEFRIQIQNHTCYDDGCWPTPLGEYWQTAPAAFGWITVPVSWAVPVAPGTGVEVIVGQYDVSFEVAEPTLRWQELRAFWVCGGDTGSPVTTGHAPAGFLFHCASNGVMVSDGGVVVLQASLGQIAGPLSIATATGQHQLITSGGGASLWALSSNELQVHYNYNPDTTKLIVPATVCGTPTVGAPMTAAPGIPTGGTAGSARHVVQSGENLFRISLRYGVSMDAIAAVNGITNYALIYVGQVLIIP
ncbi:MAG: LysM peptidoglycan-binding domain-containing protein [Anaerolineae bacterium]|nr:LysM peptidoglycan-binding domain-containing protein [Anaerolineae bacterium]